MQFYAGCDAAEFVGFGVVVAEPVGGPVEGNHDGSVQEPVEHRGRYPRSSIYADIGIG